MQHLFLRRFTHKELAEYTHEELAEFPNLIFIYNRTQADVDRVKKLTEKYLNGTITDQERTEWRKDLIGALNVSDIERIEHNTDVIAGFFEKLLPTKVWKTGDIPRVSDYARIRSNVAAIRNIFPASFPALPPVPDQPLNTYQKWNDIEKILYSIYTIYQAMLKNLNYCGTEIYAGEGVGDL